MTEDAVNHRHDTRFDQRPFGICLAITASLMVFGMMHHPSAHGDTRQEILQSMADMSRLSAVVHGGMIILMVAAVAALWGFSRALGLHRLFTAHGFMNYLFGSVAMLAAGMINGFAISNFASHFVGDADANPDALMPIIVMASAVSGIAAQIGTLLWSLGVLSWSVELLCRDGANRALGALGVIIGAAPIALLLSGNLELHVHGFLSVVAAQALWLIAIAVQMIRRAV